jgi:transposase InsO family protein
VHQRPKEALFDYIELFYNQRRRHSTLGQISPVEFKSARPRRHLPLSARTQERSSINLRQPSTEFDQAHRTNVNS